MNYSIIYVLKRPANNFSKVLTFHLGLQQGSTVAFSGHSKNKELLKLK